jgi:hypothetical protein
MITLISIIILAASLYLRLFPRLKWKEFNSTDSHFHYYYAELIRRNGNGMPERETRVLGGSNECTYPYFYHWILSYFPTNFLNFCDRFSGFVFDFLGGLTVLFLLAHLMPLSVTESCLILAAYMIAPGLTFSFIGPRPYSLTPRNFSQLIFALACACLILMTSMQGAAYVILFAAAAGLFSILLLSSQFGLQVLIALLIFGFFNWQASAAIIAGGLLSLLFDKGFFITQVKAQIMHLEWYFKHNYAFVQHKTNFSKLVKLISERDVRGVFYEIVFFNQISTTFLRHTTYFLALGLGVFAWQAGSLVLEQRQTLMLLFPLLIAFIITNFGRARVFGEAERYIEFSYPIQMFLFLSLVPQKYMGWVLIIMLAYNFVWYLYNLYQIKSQSASTYSYNPIFDVLKTKDATLFCLGNNESYLFLRNTQAKIVGFLVNISLRGSYVGFFEKFFTRYPCVNPDCVADLCRQYAVTHILQNKQNQEAKVYAYEKVVENVGGFKPIYEDEKYILYEKAL